MDDEQFESYLREFQPRKPRALPSVAGVNGVWRRLAAAAAVLVAVGAGLWLALYQKALPDQAYLPRNFASTGADVILTRVSLPALTKLAIDHPEELDAALIEASRRVLPDFRGEQSTLRLLAKE